MAYDTTETSNNIFTALQLQDTIREGASSTALSNGLTLFEKKKYKEALAAFKQAAALKPDSVDAYNGMANTYLKLGKKEDAIGAYKLSLKVDRNQEQVHINIANIYIDLKKPADAEKALKGAITVNSVSVLAHYTLGHLYAQNNRAKEAEAQFRQVVRLVPKDANGYYGLGLSLNKQGRYDEAVKTLTKAAAMKKDFVPAIAELGTAYVGLEQTDKVQEQITALTKIGTSPALLSADDLSEKIRRPKIFRYDSEKSSLNLNISAGLLTNVNTAFSAAGVNKDMTVTFKFDSEMDVASVMDVTNWRISKPRGGKSGLYDNGMYRPSDTSVPFIPKRVSYDATTHEATLVFTLRQNSTADATIDPRHMVFKFSGKDADGRTMDPTADEYAGSIDLTF